MLVPTRRKGFIETYVYNTKAGIKANKLILGGENCGRGSTFIRDGS
jgi:hypothetical protein